MRQDSSVLFNTALGKIFGVDKYAKSLSKIIKERDIDVNFFHNLVEVKADTKEAVFEILGKPEKEYKTFQVKL